MKEYPIVLKSQELPFRKSYHPVSEEEKEVLRFAAIGDFNCALKYSMSNEDTYHDPGDQASEHALIAEYLYDSGLDPAIVVPSLQSLQPRLYPRLFPNHVDEQEQVSIIVHTACVKALMGKNVDALAHLESLGDMNRSFRSYFVPLIFLKTAARNGEPIGPAVEQVTTFLDTRITKPYERAWGYSRLAEVLSRLKMPSKWAFDKAYEISDKRDRLASVIYSEAKCGLFEEAVAHLDALQGSETDEYDVGYYAWDRSDGIKYIVEAMIDQGRLDEAYALLEREQGGSLQELFQRSRISTTKTLTDPKASGYAKVWEGFAGMIRELKVQGDLFLYPNSAARITLERAGNPDVDHDELKQDLQRAEAFAQSIDGKFVHNDYLETQVTIAMAYFRLGDRQTAQRIFADVVNAIDDLDIDMQQVAVMTKVAEAIERCGYDASVIYQSALSFIDLAEFDALHGSHYFVRLIKSMVDRGHFELARETIEAFSNVPEFEQAGLSAYLAKAQMGLIGEVQESFVLFKTY